MKTYSGPFLTDEGFIQAKITIERCGVSGDHVKAKLMDYEEGGDSGIEAIIIPSLFNAHVHIGDSIVKSPPKGSLAEVVGPGGLKHISLERASQEELIGAMKVYLHEASDYGVKDIIDFREGGIEGLKVLRKAAEGLEASINLTVMARPSKRSFNECELKKLLPLTDGIGLSAYRDWDTNQIKQIAELAKDTDKPLALHCSEDVREPIQEVLELGVHHLVHMIEATTDDMIACAVEEVPIVVCPRSNLFFGKVPNIPAMLDAGLTLCLGTDNAMISSSNMLRELETAYRVARINGDVDPIDILMMATWNPRKALNLPSYMGTESREHYLVIERGNRDPSYQVVTKTSSRDILEVIEW